MFLLFHRIRCVVDGGCVVCWWVHTGTWTSSVDGKCVRCSPAPSVPRVTSPLLYSGPFVSMGVGGERNRYEKRRGFSVGVVSLYRV